MANKPRFPRIPAPPVPAATGTAQAKLPVVHPQGDRSTAAHVRQANSAVQAKQSASLPQVPPHVRQALIQAAQTSSLASSSSNPVAIAQAKLSSQDQPSQAVHAQQAIGAAQAKNLGKLPKVPPHVQQVQARMMQAKLPPAPVHHQPSFHPSAVILQTKQSPQGQSSRAIPGLPAFGAAQARNSGNLPKTPPHISQVQAPIAQAKNLSVLAYSLPSSRPAVQAKQLEEQVSSAAHVQQAQAENSSQRRGTSCLRAGEIVQANLLDSLRSLVNMLRCCKKKKESDQLPDAQSKPAKRRAQQERYQEQQKQKESEIVFKKTASVAEEEIEEIQRFVVEMTESEKWDAVDKKYKRLVERLAEFNEYERRRASIENEAEAPMPLPNNQGWLTYRVREEALTNPRLYKNYDLALPETGVNDPYQEYYAEASQGNNVKRLIKKRESPEKWFTYNGTHDLVTSYWVYWDGQRWHKWNQRNRQAESLTDSLRVVEEIKECQKLTQDEARLLRTGVKADVLNQCKAKPGKYVDQALVKR